MFDDTRLLVWTATAPAGTSAGAPQTPPVRGETKADGMRLFLDSPVLYAVVTAVLGLLALGPMIVIGLDALRGVDVFAGLMLLATLPLAIGGVLALAGGVLILKRKGVGRILATIGLVIGALHPLIAGFYSMWNVNSCGPLPIDCANRWFGIVVLLGGSAIILYVVCAVWLVRARDGGRAAA
jgi:hypothetical protein